MSEKKRWTWESKFKVVYGDDQCIHSTFRDAFHCAFSVTGGLRNLGETVDILDRDNNALFSFYRDGRILFSRHFLLLEMENPSNEDARWELVEFSSEKEEIIQSFSHYLDPEDCGQPGARYRVYDAKAEVILKHGICGAEKPKEDFTKRSASYAVHRKKKDGTPGWHHLVHCLTLEKAREVCELVDRKMRIVCDGVDFPRGKGQRRFLLQSYDEKEEYWVWEATSPNLDSSFFDQINSTIASEWRVWDFENEAPLTLPEARQLHKRQSAEPTKGPTKESTKEPTTNFLLYSVHKEGVGAVCELLAKGPESFYREGGYLYAYFSSAPTPPNSVPRKEKLLRSAATFLERGWEILCTPRDGIETWIVRRKEGTR